MRSGLRFVQLFVVLLAGILAFCKHGISAEIKANVVQVKDGDTVVVVPEEGGQGFICRLYGIDAPEVAHGGKEGQPYGEEAKNYLKRLVLNETVLVKTTGQKTYGREVCLIWKDHTLINLEMVKAGYAWAYKQYLKDPYASEFIDAEIDARNAKRGLWQQANPTPPWEWRHK